MNRGRDYVGRATWLIALSAALLASCQALGPQVVRPDWRVGDAWTYRYTTTTAEGGTLERISRQAIVGVSAGRILLSSEEELDGNTTHTKWVWNADGELMSSSTAGQPTHTYDPPLVFHRWPAEPGQSWSLSFQARTDDGESLYSKKLDFNVVGWETISVPAGTYRALKSEIHAYAPDGELTSVSAVWFAPEAKRRVKLVEQTYVRGEHASTIQHELMSYSTRR